MAFQNSINQALGTAGGAKQISLMTNQQSINDKYGPGGKVYEKLMDTPVNIKGPHGGPTPISTALNAQNPAYTASSSRIARDTAYEHLLDRLEFMTDQAIATDAAEKRAKVLGIFPTQKSRDIRAKGLARKDKNLHDAAQGAYDTFTKMRESTIKKGAENGQK